LPFAQSATDRFWLHQRTAILRRRDPCTFQSSCSVAGRL